MIRIKNIKLQNKALSNIELEFTIKKLKIPFFRGVFSRNDLPNTPRQKECGILNLDDLMGNGTHWVAWYKNKNKKYYFDSFGLYPPLEIMNYLKGPIFYNTERVQEFGTVICGHLCLYWLKEMSACESPQLIINNLLI